MWPLFFLIILIILYPIARWLLDKDMEKSNKKVQDHYKMLEEMHKKEYEDYLKEAEKQENIDKKIEQLKKEYSQNNLN